MTLGESGWIPLGTLQYRPTDEAIQSIRQIHGFGIKCGIGSGPCQATKRHNWDKPSFLKISGFQLNLRIRFNRCDCYHVLLGIFDRMGLRVEGETDV
jgi:hypothetical protein